MAKYMLLIHGVDEQWEAMTPDEAREHGAAHERFRAAAGARVVGGEELEVASTATTLRGEMTTDGPFLETKEVAARGAGGAQRGGDPAGGRSRMSSDVVAAVAEAHRRDWAQVLATTVQLTRDLELAEECAQEAFAQALVSWPSIGVPSQREPG